MELGGKGLLLWSIKGFCPSLSLRSALPTAEMTVAWELVGVVNSFSESLAFLAGEPIQVSEELTCVSSGKVSPFC
jgi:hypothetical protein